MHRMRWQLKITVLYIVTPIWMTLTFLQDDRLWEIKTSVAVFSQISQLTLMKCGMLQPIVLKLMLNLFGMINIEWKELKWSHKV